MSASFRAVVASLLPSEERVLARLHDLKDAERSGVVDYFGVALQEFDVVIGMPSVTGLAELLAERRGVPLIHAFQDGERGRWTLDTDAAEAMQTAVIVADHFTDGLPELEVVVQASRLGYLVETVACAIERTSDLGRSRLELNGLNIRAAVQVAHSPKGLVLERRFPQPG